jgi:hypothetical protein
MISNGFAKTLERPGGNVTGIGELPPGVTERRLTPLKAAAPHVTRAALHLAELSRCCRVHGSTTESTILPLRDEMSTEAASSPP